jgi:hypothetical protein
MRLSSKESMHNYCESFERVKYQPGRNEKKGLGRDETKHGRYIFFLFDTINKGPAVMTT